jgi:LDH2 family malate/lactate/ureidoglycolate dehydrogenase
VTPEPGQTRHTASAPAGGTHAAADGALLRAYAEEALASAGAGAEDASAWADLLLHASLRGVDSHGVASLLPVFCEQALAGIGAAGTAPAIAEDRGAVCVVEGRRAGGARTARLAMDAAAERARSHGAGVAVARSIGYFGSLAWTVEPAAAGGLVAVCACNAMAFVAPHGGREALHGTNPIAVAVPATPDPILVDMRTNAFRMADYRAGLADGRPLPDGVLLGPDGSFITDVAELERLSWEGAVSLPAAGAKGYGLALVVDVLTAALAGTPIGREIQGWDDEQTGLAAFFLALDPAAFAPPELFAAAVARLAEQAHATAPLEEGVPVRLPGERAAGERRLRLASGVPLEAGAWGRMESELRALGLEPPAPPVPLAS